MELKEVVKDLGLENDINQLSLEELREKYLSDWREYSEFVSRFSRLFFKRKFFPIRIAEQYEKLKEFIAAGAKKYPTKTNEALSKEYDLEVDYYLKNYDVKDKVDDIGCTISYLLDSTGANKIKHEPKYKDLIESMYKAACKYEFRGDIGVGDFEEYYALVRLNIDQTEYERALTRYYADHQLTNECMDLGFLFYANYLIVSLPSAVNDELLQNVEDVINMSDFLFEIGDNSREKVDDYHRLAKYTMKNIKRYRKNKKKEQKRRIKELSRMV